MFHGTAGTPETVGNLFQMGEKMGEGSKPLEVCSGENTQIITVRERLLAGAVERPRNGKVP